MKYKVLLTGANHSVIDDFFVHMDEVFEVQFSSSRYEDLVSHANYFRPNIFVYCMDSEPREVMSRMVSVKNNFSRRGIPFCVIGDKEDCDIFTKITAGVADCILERPLTAKMIQDAVIKFLTEPKKQAEEEEKQKKQIEEQRKIIEEQLLQSEKTTVKKHILVVDDDFRMLKVIKEQLRSDYDVATAINGKLALKFLENNTTDLILLDYVMPEENGPAVLKKIHDNPRTKDVPVVFLTGMTEREKIQEALSEKPQGYLLKPIDREKLLSTIQTIIH